MSETDLNAAIAKQTETLKIIANHFSLETEEKQEFRIKRILLRAVALITLAAGATVGAWEIATYVHEQWQIHSLADNYAYVSEEIYYKENNPEVALNFLDKAIELVPDNTEYRFLKAYIEGMASVRTLINLDRPYNQEEMNQAHSAMASSLLLMSSSPDSSKPYILRGQIHAALKEHDRAIEQLDKAIKLEPENDFALVRMAVVKNNQGNNSEALKYLDKALIINPKSKWALLWKGKIQGQALNKWQLARNSYNAALKIDSRFDLAYYNLAWTWLKQKPRNYEKARKNFEKSLTINPSFKEAFYGLGMVYGYQNLYVIAHTYLNKAIEIDNKFLTAWEFRAIVNDEVGKYEDALADLNHAIELSPNSAKLFIRRGRILEKKGDLNQAVKDLHFASNIEPNNKKVWLYLGRVFKNIGEYTKAINFYSQAINIQSSYTEAYIERGQAYAGLKQWDKAEGDFDRAIDVTKYRPEKAYIARGDYFAERSLYKKAVLDYKIARVKNSTYSKAWFKEARLLAKIGNKKKAVESINRYIELEPLNQEAFQFREQLMN